MKIQIFLVLAALAAVSSANEGALTRVSSSNNQFASQLFRAVSSKKPEKNLIVSPLSVHTLLALLYEGAEGPTEKSLQNVLKLGDKRETAQGYKSLTTSLLNTQGVTLTTANQIFLQKGLSLKKGFADTARNEFAAGAQELDFKQSDRAASTINRWVEDSTNRKIRDLVTSGDLKDAAMVLTNAVYFKGLWETAFNKNLTKKGNFQSTRGVQTVDMMRITGDFKYANSKSLGAQVLEMPYKGEQVKMVIVLPNPDTTLDAVEAKMANVDINEIIQQTAKKEVIVTLPRFKIESTVQLTDALKEVGLSQMFSDNAKFGGITDAQVKVSKAVQKAFIEVNEEGTEAAAATAIHIVPLSLPVFKFEPVKFNADRPFSFYLVTELSNGNGPNAVLFSGLEINYLSGIFDSATKYFVADHPFLFYVCTENAGVVLFTGKVVQF